ncbi:MAG: hypothetical protein WDZ51_19885 [Pirellulaceae bacterium]
MKLRRKICPASRLHWSMGTEPFGRAMEAEDFQVYENEWWHFDFDDWKNYRIGNATFEQLTNP